MFLDTSDCPEFFYIKTKNINLDILITKIWVFFSFFSKSFFEYSRWLHEICFGKHTLCEEVLSPCTGIRQKSANKKTTFQNDGGGGGDFCKIVVLQKQMQHIHPTKSLATISFIFGEIFNFKRPSKSTKIQKLLVKNLGFLTIFYQKNSNAQK